MLNINIKVKQLLFLFCCSLVWQGCNIINPVETTPTYIHIDSFQFNSSPSYLNISNSHQVSTVSVYYNNNPIGDFDLPATIPIIATGKGDLEIFPGVLVNGLNNSITAYPFYRPDTSKIAAQPGKVINYTPHTNYYPNLKTLCISNFETSEPKFSMMGGNIGMTAVSDDSLVYEGHYAGRIQLNNVGDSSVDSNIVAFAIPTGYAFIEFNYKSDIPFYVGMQANLSNVVSTGPLYLAGIKPSPYWQKFYLNVGTFNQQYQGTTNNFYIKAVLGSGQTNGRLLIDNIQLITF